MKLVDTHAHAYVDEFANDPASMIERSLTVGIERILMPAIDSSTHEKMFRMQELYPETCFAMMGVHPCSIKEDYQKELRIAAAHFSTRKFIAVGEIGLDYYWDLTFKVQQVTAFHEQIDWALAFDIPIVIHSRNATDECIQIVKERQEGSLKGVFHCFSGTVEQAAQLAELGFYLGIGGVLTYKKAGLDQVLEKVPIGHLVLETDAPYLSPVPFRGKRNESSYLIYIAQKLAEVKKTSLEEIAQITTANAEKLFGLL